ncbi:Ferritin-1 heavy chain-like protein [Aphelenchoides bicaudatus]|nr:Ferritin-1 heavy chain-like protein [Aphelenchoides bicaudatus]
MNSKQNFHPEIEEKINVQIGNELNAFYVYLAISNWCRRTDIALYGAAKYFLNQSNEERQHAQKLIEYQNDRGGKVELATLESPSKQEWQSLLEAFKDAFDLEQANNKALLELHALASEKNDPDLTNLLEEFYLREQVYEIKEMAAKYAQLKRVGEGLGVHLFDKELAEEMEKKKED